MGQVIPRQHPAVVLRSSYRQLRALLAIALVAVACLSVAVVILANDDEGTTTATPHKFEPIRYGDFNPATGSPLSTPRPTGGPEESGVAAAIAPKPVPVKPNVATPDESKVAASIARAQLAKQQSQPTPQSGPDESSVAAAIAGR